MAEVAENDLSVEQAAPAQEAQEDVPAAANGAADADPEARYRYDDSLLIRVKGKVKRPAKPDEADRDVPLNKLKAEIDKYSARIKDIKEIVDASRSSRDSQSAGNKEIIKRLQALRNEFQSVLRQKQHIREELQATLKSRDDLRTASRQLRDRLPRGVNMDNLEAQLAELEYKMQHESGADDKYLFKRIQELNQARPMLREYTDTEAKLKSLDGVRADIQARLSQCDAVLNDVKAREEAERAVLDEARGKQAANEPDIPTLNAEKKECWDIIQALRAKMDDVRKEFSAKYVEWIKLDKNYNNYMRSVKRKEWEERQKAREARESAQQDADAQDPSNPNAGGGGGAAAGAAGGAADAPVAEAYAAEVFTLDQLLTYLRKLVPADVQAAAAGSQKKEVEVPKGMKLLKKNEEDDFFSVARKKPVGKKGSAAAAAPAAAEPSSSKPAADSGKRKLNHTLELLQTFMRFSIEVPQTVAELPATIEKAEAKKAYYLELRRTGKKHEEPKPARAAAAAEPIAASEASGSSSSGAAQGAAPTPAEAAQRQAEQRSGGAADTPAAADAAAVTAPVAAAAPDAQEEEPAAAAADDDDGSNGPAQQQEEQAAAAAAPADEFEAAAAPAELPPAVAAAAEEEKEGEEPAAAAAQEEEEAAAAPASAEQQQEAPSGGLGVDLAVDETSGTVALKLNLA